ncbi:MAG: energy-coupled thiamine transporter ThiT [Clostridiaceae bacterium]|jgi:thiamine transporter|nr:energy-coupled thiamine transporter ThiT [Clostridiaceae bacterium]
MKKNNTQMLVEAGIMLAMAVVLSEFVKLFKMPMGGSVTLGGMVPIFIFAFRWGGKKGLLVGAVYGILDLIIGFYPAHPLSILLDYPLAYGMLGLAGFFKKNTAGYISGIVTGIAGRFVMHVISGVAFFASYAIEAGKTPLVYSVSYNAPYLGVEMAIAIVLSLLIMKFVKLPEART